MTNTVTANSDNFDEIINGQGDKTIVVDFWATWCGPCKMIAPLLEEIADERVDDVMVVKVDVDSNQDLSQKYAVRAIPTLLVFKGGEVVGQHVGALGKTDLDALIQKGKGD